MPQENKVRIKKHHQAISSVFPLGYETTYTKSYTTEEKIAPGFWTRTHNISTWVPEVITPKGTFIDCVFIGNNGGEYSGDWFYKMTGKSFSEFMEKI